jgi:hypothetical protein
MVFMDAPLNVHSTAIWVSLSLSPFGDLDNFIFVEAFQIRRLAR